jgi:hypothetical protein
VFTDQIFLKKSAGTKWYQNINKTYKNILSSNGYNVLTKKLRKDDSFDVCEVSLSQIVSEATNKEIYIFNPIDFACFIVSYDDHKSEIFDMLDKIKYIVIWQEILPDNFEIIGYRYSHMKKDLTMKFFRNSILNISSNLVSISTLMVNNIYHNKYFPVTGYSQINSIIPLNENGIIKDIDVFIYGTMDNSYEYRKNMISRLIEINNNKHKIIVNDNIFDSNLDSLLIRSKIIVHIPSHNNLVHMPWPKITYLQAKKVFFIIEDNDELHYNVDIEKIVRYYKRGNVYDIIEKIDYFLNNENDRIKNIEENYQYTTNNLNMDKNIPDIIQTLVLGKLNNK